MRPSLSLSLPLTHISISLSLSPPLSSVYLSLSHHCTCSLSPDVDVQKQCLLVMGFPPSPTACVESPDFVGNDTEQLVKLIVQVRNQYVYVKYVCYTLSLPLSLSSPSTPSTFPLSLSLSLSSFSLPLPPEKHRSLHR